MSKIHKKKKSEKATNEELGKMLVNIYETGYINHNQTYKYSFLKGVATGVGGVIGATVVIAILLSILSKFEQVPVIGPFVNKVQNSIEAGSPAK
jgi:uncharacterized protein (DUF697 family)